MKKEQRYLKQGVKLNFLLVILIMGMLFPTSIFGQEIIKIQVSPHVLNIQSNGVVVSIHTNIAFSAVVASGVTMNSVEIQSWKADNNGFFVAKFNMDEIKDLEELEIDAYNTFTLEGTKTDGGTFTGSEDVMVIDVVPKGKK